MFDWPHLELQKVEVLKQLINTFSLQLHYLIRIKELSYSFKYLKEKFSSFSYNNNNNNNK